MRYRKLPVEIDAVQWTGTNLFAIMTFIEGVEPNLEKEANISAWATYQQIVEDKGLRIHTLAGIMDASIGDFIIKGISGDYYPRNPEAFKATYEKVNEKGANKCPLN